MNTDTIVQALKESIAAVGAMPRSALPIGDDEPLLDGGLGLDSVMLMQVILEIETRLGFAFAESDLRTRSFSSLRALAGVIEARLTAAERAA